MTTVPLPFSDIPPAERRTRLLELEPFLLKHLIGQDKVIQEAVNFFKEGLSNIEPPHKPRGSILSLGPTGTGKTELAKLVGEHIWGSRQDPLLISMGDYKGAGSVGTFIGEAGRHEGTLHQIWSELEERDKKRKGQAGHRGGIIILDEIEKATKDILTILLGMLEEGYVYTANGTRMNFSPYFIICTSNLGAAPIAEERHINVQSLFDGMLAEARKVLLPELVQRFGLILTYQVLKKEVLNEIVRRKVKEYEIHLQTTAIPANCPELHCRGIETDQPVVDYIRSKLNEDHAGARNAARHVRKNLAPVILDYVLNNFATLVGHSFKLRVTMKDYAPSVIHLSSD